MDKVLYKDEAGNVLGFEDNKLCARNAEGKLVDGDSLKTIIKKANPKTMQIRAVSIGNRDFFMFRR